MHSDRELSFTGAELRADRLSSIAVKIVTDSAAGHKLVAFV